MIILKYVKNEAIKGSSDYFRRREWKLCRFTRIYKPSKLPKIIMKRLLRKAALIGVGCMISMLVFTSCDDSADEVFENVDSVENANDDGTPAGTKPPGS